MIEKLIDKSIMVFGGTGYVGGNFAKKASFLKAKVYAVARNQPKIKFSNIHYIKGNALDPQSYRDKIKDCNVIIHSIGTLIDTSYTKNKKPGQQGTYQNLCRDTLFKILQTIQQFKQQGKKKIIYVKGARHPPFVPRYQSCKLQAINKLFQSSSVNSVVVDPGFIYSSQRPVTYLIKNFVNVWSKVYPKIYSIVSRFNKEPEVIKNAIGNEFLVQRSINLEDLIRCMIVLCFNDDYNSQILNNDKIQEVSSLLK